MGPTDANCRVRPLTAADARVAAALHAAGQPGTFLTRLGLPFLRALYGGMASSPLAFGFVAERQGRVVGVIVGADDTGALFRDVLRRSWWRLAISVALGVLRDPSLLPMVWAARDYPVVEEAEPRVGEWLFIGVDPAERRQGLGSVLLQALLEAARGRGLRGLILSVDAANATAIRFHERHGFVYRNTVTLFGRPMHFYRLDWEA